MSELENQVIDDVYQEDTSTDLEEYQNDTAELAPDSEPEHEQNTEESQAEEQSRATEVINKKHRQMREAEERAQRAEEQLSRLQQNASYSQAPNVPDLPDPYEVDEAAYTAALKQRDDAIKMRAQWDANQQQLNYQKQQQQIQQQQQQQRDLAQKAEGYQKRAKDYGIKPEALQQSAQVLVSYGLNDAIANEILVDDKGPLITRHLASNPMELSEVVGMNPIQAALYIERNIKPKLADTAPKRTSAPKPKGQVKGQTYKKGDHPALQGATFE